LVWDYNGVSITIISVSECTLHLYSCNAVI